MIPTLQTVEPWYISWIQLVGKRVPALATLCASRAQRCEIEANAAYERDDLVRAAAGYRRAIEWQPDNAEYLGKLGQIQSEQGEFADAERNLRLALAHDHQSRRSLKTLALVLLQQDKLADAMYYYLRFAGLEPDDADVCYNLGVIFFKLGRYDEALDWSGRAWALAPADPLVPRMRVQALAAVGRLDETDAVLDDAMKRFPEDFELDRLRGWILDLRGQPEASLAAYEEAKRKSPENADVRLQVARVSAFLGRFASAKEESERAAKLFVDSRDKQGAANAYWELGWCHYNLGDMAASAQASSEALKFESHKAPVHFNLGLALLHLGRFAEAQSAYQAGVDQLDDVSDLKSHAIDDLRKALERDPAPEGARQMLSALESLYDTLSQWLAVSEASAKEPVAAA